jgi:hypothetical protein
MLNKQTNYSSKLYSNLKKRFGVQVMKVQRNFPYPIKQTIYKIPPIETPRKGTTLVILAQHKTFTEALWTAYSWNRFLNKKLALKLVLDGEVTNNQKKLLHTLFPSGEIIGIDQCINSVSFSGKGLNTFIKSHKFGKVLALKLALQKQNDILFSDPDVLVFNHPAEIIDKITHNTGCYFAESNAQAISPWIQDKAKKLSLKLSKDFNSGVLYIPQNSFSLELCSALLEDWTPEISDYFPEQTVCDVLMTASQAVPLPPEHYVVSNEGMWFWEKDTDYSAIKVRHFVGNVRHRMYTSGYPIVRDLMLEELL